MRRLALRSLLVLSAAQMAGCPYVEIPTQPGARISTSLGDFVIALDAELAPLTVANFLQYVEDDFYDGTIFHRVVPDFVVQGGGLTADLVSKETRAPIPSEAANGLSNARGTIAMARTDDPNSATAQFFINLVDNTELDATPAQPGYTVFGQVIEGMEVVDLIAAVPTEDRDELTDVPVEDVIISDIEWLDLSDGEWALTAAGEAYLESIQLRTQYLARELLVQLVGFALFPP